jgi:hypothetical protein
MASQLASSAPQVLTLRSLTRQDLRRIRRGEVDGPTMSRLLDQSRALTPMALPRTGALVANETGWLLGVGGPIRRLHSSFNGWMRASALLMPFGQAWQSMLELPRNLAIMLALATAPFFIMWGVFGLWTRGQLAGRWKRARAIQHAAEVPTGTPVRLSGVIPAQATMASLFRGQPAVLSRNRMVDADELRGIDFRLVLDDGEQVQVEVREAFLLDRPRRSREAPACGPVSVDHVGNELARLRSALLSPASSWQRLLPFGRHETSVGPGDRIEVCGVLHREPAPDGEAGPGRPTPMRLSVRAGAGAPLLIRKLGPVARCP